MKQIIHKGHQGIERCKQRARNSIFWPGISAEIKDMVANCSTCLTFRNKQQRETLIPHPMPTQPWAEVATDLFTLHNRLYVIAVDFYSKFVEVERIDNKES